MHAAPRSRRPPTATSWLEELPPYEAGFGSRAHVYAREQGSRVRMRLAVGDGETP